MPKSQLYQGFAVCYTREKSKSYKRKVQVIQEKSPIDTREKSKSALKGLKKESIGRYVFILEMLSYCLFRVIQNFVKFVYFQ